MDYEVRLTEEVKEPSGRVTYLTLDLFKSETLEDVQLKYLEWLDRVRKEENVHVHLYGLTKTRDRGVASTELATTSHEQLESPKVHVITEGLLKCQLLSCEEALKDKALEELNSIDEFSYATLLAGMKYDKDNVRYSRATKEMIIYAKAIKKFVAKEGKKDV